jgi:DNA modification methylase
VPTERRSNITSPQGHVTCGDNLPLLQSIDDESCALIYVDPPFNSNRRRGCSTESDLGYSDQHDGGLQGYLDFLRPRLMEMKRILADSGTLYVHLDWRTVHYVKVMLDEIFGINNFLNEIIWSYRTGSRPSQWFSRKHDTLLVYVKEMGRHTFNRQRCGTYRTKDLQVDDTGRAYKSTKNGPIYFHPHGPMMTDVWEIPFLSTVSKERTGYPTQKPEALIERIIQASTNEGDVVADFFCGSGTTPVVAKRLRRGWIACDVNPDAVRVTQDRLSQKA